MITEGNKTRVEKTGLDDEIRDGYEYEMAVALEIVNDKHMAKASKDRTQLFVDKPEFIITVETGKAILNWCNQGETADIDYSSYIQRINDCKSIDDLLKLYQANPQVQTFLLSQFTKKRQLLSVMNDLNSITHQNESNNGTDIK